MSLGTLRLIQMEGARFYEAGQGISCHQDRYDRFGICRLLRRCRTFASRLKSKQISDRKISSESETASMLNEFVTNTADLTT